MRLRGQYSAKNVLEALGAPPDEDARSPFAIRGTDRVAKLQLFSGELEGPDVVAVNFARAKAGAHVVRDRMRSWVDVPRAEVGIVPAVGVADFIGRRAGEQVVSIDAPHRIRSNRTWVPHDLNGHMTIGTIGKHTGWVFAHPVQYVSVWPVILE